MLPDTSVTESNSTTVNGYSTIDNAAEFYDRAKLYLYDNFVGEDNTLVFVTVHQLTLVLLTL